MADRFIRLARAAGAVGLVSLALAGCMTAAATPKPTATLPALDTPAGAGVNVPAGSSEDFIVNVGRRTYFAQSSAELDSVARATLDKQADWLRRFPNWTVKIQGFADDPGSKEANVALSSQRAQAVRAYLASQGIGENRMSTKGYGRDRLVRDCPDLSCKAQNRRVITNLQGDRDV